MAYNNYYNNNRYNNRGGGSYQGGQNQAPRQTPAQPKEIPDDYAAAAEAVMSNSVNVGNITTSKLRSMFSLFCDMYNEVKHSSGTELTQEQKNALTGARVRLIYECGRESKTKKFVDAANLVPYMLSIGSSSEKMLKFYHYF